MEKILHTTPKSWVPIDLVIDKYEMTPAYSAPDNPILLEGIEGMLRGICAHKYFTESNKVYLTDRDWRKLFALVRREAEYRGINYCGLLIRCKQYRADLVIDVTKQHIHPYYKGCEIDGVVHRAANKHLQLQAIEQKIANLIKKRDKLRYDIHVQEALVSLQEDFSVQE